MAYVTGTTGNDTLFGTVDADTIEGLDGDDVLKGSAGADVMNGGAGIDTADYRTGADFFAIIVDLRTGSVQVNYAPDDQLIGIENVIGYGGADQLTGDAGPNRLDGWSGNDVLDGGEGADVLIGNQGSDWANYASSSAGVSINLKTGIVSGGTAEGDTLIEIENIIGSAFDDILIGDDRDIIGNANELRGGAGNDYLEGGLGDDALYGEDGDDWIVARVGDDDLISGGSGIDTLDYSGSTKAVLAQFENSSGIENWIGSAWNDNLYGTADINVISAGGGDDAIQGGWGADVLDGGDGNDRAFFGTDSGAVWVHLGTGEGFWNEAEGDSFINIENLFGTRGNDLLYGSDADNIIQGDWGDDNIGGGAGADRLFGGIGADLLDGGTGADHIDGGTESMPPPGSPAVAKSDTVDFTYQFGAVSVSLRWGAGYWNSAEGDTYVNIENVKGTAFNDFIEGDSGANVLTGGGGEDLFTARPGFGADVITDFAGNGSAPGDRIQFTDGMFAGFQDLLSHASQVGDDVVIALDGASHLTLQGVQLESLHGSDFIFL